VVLMATAFLDMAGALIILPLLPFYGRALGAGGLQIMVLVSAFSAMQLMSAPLWGRVSDRRGRKPTLLLGLGVSAAGTCSSPRVRRTACSSSRVSFRARAAAPPE